MSENETPTSEQNPQPKKSNRSALIVAIAMALGLFGLIALNMK